MKISLRTDWFESALSAMDPWVRHHRTAVDEVARAWDDLPVWARWVLPLGILGAVLVLGVVASLDWSRAMSAREAGDFAAWVQSTHSAQVVAALDEARGDGRLTINEASAVIEVAKSAAIPEGMMQPLAEVQP